ncbi:MAG: flotillin-like FloA family protein [Bacteroidales bacterium]|nr:flotillin-like FloA family protein [Bacteroidales bacterium]
MGIILIIIILSLIVLFFWYYAPIGLWYEAKLSGIDPGIMNMLKMRLQKIPHKLIISNLVKAHNSDLKIDSHDLMKKYLAGVDITSVTDTAIRALNAGLDVSYNDLTKQYLAKVDVSRVIHAMITAQNAGLDVNFNELSSYYLSNVDVIKVIEALVTVYNAGFKEITLSQLKEHYLSNGDVTKSVEAFIAAREANYRDITFREILAIDLADIDVTEAVSWCINPKVVETKTISGIAGDGIQLQMKLKLTLRANLKNMIGGATEQTVLARVDENLSSEIGKAENHREILKSPFLLAKKVEQKELGKGTAFEILSVDVSEVKVGKDIQAELLSKRAKANAEKAKADYIKAEEKVQKAMAAAFIDGNLSVEEYNNIQNTEADTEMRKKIGESVNKKKDKK